jgi:hypothetical protein
MNVNNEGRYQLPGLAMWDLWWTKWHCGRFSSILRFPLPILSFYQLLHTHQPSGAGTGGSTKACVYQADSAAPHPSNNQPTSHTLCSVQLLSANNTASCLDTLRPCRISTDVSEDHFVSVFWVEEQDKPPSCLFPSQFSRRPLRHLFIAPSLRLCSRKSSGTIKRLYTCKI